MKAKRIAFQFKRYLCVYHNTSVRVRLARWLVKWLFSFTCLRERMAFGLVIVSLLVGQAQKFAPSILGKYVEVIKTGKLALAVLALVVSLTLLVQSFFNPSR